MQSSLQLIQSIYDSFAQGNLAKVLGSLDEHVVVYQPESLPYGGVFQGREGFINWVASVFHTWEHYQIAPLSFWELGDDVIVMGEITFRVSAATDSVRLPFVDFWKTRAGAITELRVFHWDTARMLRLLPDPDATRLS